jgi:type II secretory ATPase GspE/PulE/Tfp pilus assembly ATPase PilB-like protein
MRVRYRVDGVLHEAATVPQADRPRVVSRIKILSDLDIAERRLPQDGRISLNLEAATSTSASSRCPRHTARTSSCGSWTRAR